MDLTDNLASLNTSLESTTTAFDIIVRDEYRHTVEALSGGRNTVIYDAYGNPHEMVVIPRFNYEDLGLPDYNLGTGTPTAFLTNGVARSEILIGKYKFCDTPNGIATIPGYRAPNVAPGMTEARALMLSMGSGFHLFSVHEHAALLLWSIANNTLPIGPARSTGFNPVKPTSRGILSPLNDGSTLSGSGPREWSHDHSLFGVTDIHDGFLSRLDQCILVDGQICYTEDNQPDRDPSTYVQSGVFLESTNDIKVAEPSNANVGNLIWTNNIVNRNGDIGSNLFGPRSGVSDFKSMIRAQDFVSNQMLQRLLLDIPNEVTLPDSSINVRNYGTRSLMRSSQTSTNSNQSPTNISFSHSLESGSSGAAYRVAYFP